MFPGDFGVLDQSLSAASEDDWHSVLKGNRFVAPLETFQYTLHVSSGQRWAVSEINWSSDFILFIMNKYLWPPPTYVMLGVSNPMITQPFQHFQELKKSTITVSYVYNACRCFISTSIKLNDVIDKHN